MAGPTMLAIVGGVVFILVWIAASAGWAVLQMSAAAMGNDSGKLTPERHVSLLIAMAIGIALCALAVVPGGLAFFLVEKRSMLTWIFGAMVGAGLIVQATSFALFFVRLR